MDLKVSSVNFGHHAYGGEVVNVSKKAADLAAREGQGVVDALTEFSSSKKLADFSYPGNWFQRIFRQFMKPRHSVFDSLDVGVRKAQQAAEGKETMVISSSRFMSGQTLPGATVEVKIPYPPTKEATLRVLEEAAAKAREASDRNYSAYILRHPDAAIKEDLTKKSAETV